MFSRVLLYLLILIYLALLVSIIVKIKSKYDLSMPDRRVLQLHIQHDIKNMLDLDRLMFQNYITRFNKTYSAKEYQLRLKNFKASLSEIARLNAIEDNAVFGMTKFSDMSAQEFSEQMLMKRVRGACISYNKLCPQTTDNASLVTSTPTLLILDKIDWRSKGVIGPVIDQKQCRGCWAVSIAGVMEAMAKINNISKEVLSAQELLDCLVDKGKIGCRGGNVALTLVVLCEENLDVIPAKRYPLTLKTEKCQLRKNDTGVKLKSFMYMCNKQRLKESEEEIQRALMKGPITAVVNAAIWRFYLGGIIRRACVRSDSSFEHVIQIVGFDRTGEIPYYIVKNSWGEAFGDHGYVKLEMNKNMCGIAEEVGIIDVK